MPLSNLPRRVSKWSREHWLLCGSFVCLGALVAGIVPAIERAVGDSAPAERLTTLPLALPPVSAAVVAEARRSAWQIVNVQPGQTLGAIFQKFGLSGTVMHRILELPSARQPLTRLRVGAELAFDIAPDGALRGLRFDRDESSIVELSVGENAIEETLIERPTERRVMVASGEIRNSLYADGAKVGLGAAVINEMANVFSYDIDFSRDLQVGDRFQVMYEEVWREGERLRHGGIIGASFVNRGKEFSALRFERNGKSEYFDASGRPLRKSFMRMPIEFARISSRFNPKRRHPVLGTVRAHKGVDYAARTGTPIMAAGNGRVSFAGWQNGFGRTVVIDHGNGITTLYGHMSRLGNYKVGQHVGQGNVIGYVGATGLASGPHLHYEFRVRGAHRDPLTVTMPKPEPLKGSEMIAFRAATAPVLARLERIEGTQLARR
ncbi:MAG TPA: peptidoglycan DD-metalloendopeptidase family protein [Arenimonas sp.]|nr:peptidoglycan DD-metalloendopeptidase family protein [Arenimonas sp.]